MKNITRAIIASLCLIFIFTQTQAAPNSKNKPSQQVQKERLVLMPLRLGEADQQLQGAMEMALVKGLQQKYEVFFGEQVAKKAREIFMKESRNTAKKECDETRCLQGIAEAFQAELLATANITKQSDGYFIALSVQNLFDNKVVQSESLPCKGCDAYAVVDKLKGLVGTTASVAEPLQPPISPIDTEGIQWTEVQKGNSIEDYEAYLAQYPKGRYGILAKGKIKKLKEDAVVEAKRQQDQAASEQAQQDQSAWDTANSAATEASYQAYLDSYPRGSYANLAHARLAKLKKEASQLAAKQSAEIARQARESAAQQAALARAEAAQSRSEPAVKLLNTSDATVRGGIRLLTNKNFRSGEPERFALVVGNSDYQYADVPKLKTPANDANAMAETLYKLGFSVIVAINADQKSMNRAIMDFGEHLGPSSVSLFYYAGHALQVKGKNYLVPVDADISRESMVSAETIDLDSVLDNTSASKVGIVILDACRKNPFKMSGRNAGGSEGLARIDSAPMGSYIAYATSPGSTVVDDVDGSGRHSIYTAELITNMVKPGLSIEEVFKNVRIGVMRAASSDEQIPWESSSLTGAFYFSGAPVSQ